MLKFFSSTPMNRLRKRFQRLYGKEVGDRCLERLAMLVGRYGVGLNGQTGVRRWDERDTLLITYADMVRRPGENPLQTLRRFAKTYMEGAVSTIHILPFFPYSSDDGFSVIDYLKVNPQWGNWEDVRGMGDDFDLMFDLVLNHVSGESEWFKQFVSGVAPYRHYFIEVEPGTDLSQVVRPRINPLLRKTQTRDGEKYVWTTFSADQVDVDFRNPDVLFDYLDILFYYLSMGARIIRLDAIAYLWKRVSTPCIHLPETHEVVKLFRDILGMVAPRALLLTETNVPHPENISYFGQGDEAHMVYQFTLPPLVLHALLSGRADYLTGWAADLAPPPKGCTFLNFTASHDGIGVRPAEGILPPEEFGYLVDSVQKRGGFVSSKTNPDGSESPYELNITYFDALRPLDDEPEERHVARFLCSQAIPLVLRGVPAVYFNSLVAAENNVGGVELTGLARTINRGKWQADDLEQDLAADTVRARVFNAYTRLLKKRAQCPAFHPDSSQSVLRLHDSLFAVQRVSPDGNTTIAALANVSDREIDLPLKALRDAGGHHGSWRDILCDEPITTTRESVKLSAYQVRWLEVD